MESAFELRKKIEDSEKTLKENKQRLDGIISRCCHEWGEIYYEPIVTGGYTTQGTRSRYGSGEYIPYDEIPYLDGVYVPRKETPQWSRTCKKCGKKEFTKNKKDHVTSTPVF